MASWTIAACSIVALFAVFQCCAADPVLVGGWTRQSVGDNALFEELAHFAVSRQVGDREFFDTVLELVDVQTQVVAGTNYRIKFKTAESTCRVTDTYSKELCLPKSRETVKDTCTAVIYDVPWLTERSVSSFTCEGDAVST
ncbi:mialostatin-like [Dermacentor variabilis]|uniref:mialostatin-like n=1 Tax=Dermacentor variabilis TaxID=34621 RepID=UPI003F5CB541